MLAQDALDPAASLDLRPNVFADQNLIVGSDFEVTPKYPIQPTPAPVAPAVFPGPTGNVKIASDLFLQGELYSLRQTGNPPAPTAWLSLSAYIKSFQPDVQASSQPVSVPIPGSAATVDLVSSGSLAPILLTSSLAQVDPAKVRVFAAVAGVQYLAAFTGNQNTVGYTVSAKIAPAGSQLNTFNLVLSWTVSGAILSAGNYIPPISNLYISWVVIFYPK